MTHFIMSRLCDDCERRFYCTWKSEIMRNCSEYVSEICAKEEKRMEKTNFTSTPCATCIHKCVCKWVQEYDQYKGRLNDDFVLVCKNHKEKDEK